MTDACADLGLSAASYVTVAVLTQVPTVPPTAVYRIPRGAATLLKLQTNVCAAAADARGACCCWPLLLRIVFRSTVSWDSCCVLLRRGALPRLARRRAVVPLIVHEPEQKVRTQHKTAVLGSWGHLCAGMSVDVCPRRLCVKNT